VLGFTRANGTATGGEVVSMALLDYLAMHPATAKRIVTKLCVRFVADEAPPSLVTALTKVYLDNRTAIAPVLRALFASAEFAASIGAKTRTPLEDIVATVRLVGYGAEKVTADNPTGTKGLQGLYWTVQGAGHTPLAWAPPNGYPDVAAAWASPSGTLARWNAHLQIVAGWWPSQLVRPASLAADLVGTLPATYGGLIDALAMRLFGRTLAAADTAALTAFYGKTPSSALRAKDAAVNWACRNLVALMLNTPYFTVR
jgi:uncharacterized protein (DUF1800 family)